MVRSHQKPDQRSVVVTADNAETLLGALGRGDYRFGSNPETNDPWLDLTLATRQEEAAFVERVRAALGRRYTPLGRAPIGDHCP